MFSVLCAPTYLYQGKHDWIVDVEQSRALVKKLQRHKVPVKYDEAFFGHVATFLFDEEEVRRVGDFFIEQFGLQETAPAAG